MTTEEKLRNDFIQTENVCSSKGNEKRGGFPVKIAD